MIPRTEHIMVSGETRKEVGIRSRRKRPLKTDARKPPLDRLAANRKKQRREAVQRLPKKPVDPFATVPVKDRPMTSPQRSELAALSRDPFLNFPYRPTLTRGEADRLIPALRKVAKERRREQQKQPTKSKAGKS